MSDESFHQLMRKSHVVQYHRKVVLGSTKQIGTEDNGQRFRRHMVVFFALRHTIQVLSNTTKQVEVRLRQSLDNRSDFCQPFIEVLDP